jgi:hypothetical protein
MKTDTGKRYGLVRHIGFGFLMILLACCRSIRPTIEVLTQNDVTCQVAVQTKWGSNPGELGYQDNEGSTGGPDLPVRFQLDEEGNVYVADVYNNRVVKFAPDGQFIRNFEVPLSNGKRSIWDISARGNYLAVAADDYVYVFDSDGQGLRLGP